MEEIKNPEIEVAKEVNEALSIIGKVPEKDFWGFVKGLPSMIIQSGLPHTLAFIRSKEGDKYKAIYNAFNKYGKQISQADDDFLKYLISNDNIDLEKYLYYQSQILQFAIWFKRIGLAIYDTSKKS